MPPQTLATIPVRSLLEYIDAYGISKDIPLLEKSDLVNTILEANITEYHEEVLGIEMIVDPQVFRQTTPGFRDWYKRSARESVENGVPLFPFSTSHSTPSSATSSPASNTASPGSRRRNQPSHNTSRTPERARSAHEANENESTESQDPFTTPERTMAGTTNETSQAEFIANEQTPWNTISSFERERRPYGGSPQMSPTRPRSSSAVDDRFRGAHLNMSEPLDQRRPHSSGSDRYNPTFGDSPPRGPPQSQSPPQSPSIPMTLREIVDNGIDISTLSTSTLLYVMRENNCPIPLGALEKEDLVERVEEMASFVISGSSTNNDTPAAASAGANDKPPIVRDDDEDDCHICYERVADYCLVPCGHTGFCFMCARKMQECPFCKKTVGHAQKLWKV